MEEAVEINLNKLALKCRSKKKMYNLMVTDCDIYMPPMQMQTAGISEE